MPYVYPSALVETVLGGDYESLVLARTLANTGVVNLHSFYRLKEAAGSTSVVDLAHPNNNVASPPDYTGVVGSDVTLGYATGQIDGNTGARFNGLSNASVNVPSIFASMGGGPPGLSIDCWAIADPAMVIGSQQGLIGTNKDNGYQLHWDGATVTFSIAGTQIKFAYAGTGLAYIAGTWTGDNTVNGMKLYVNGVLQSQGTSVAGITSGASRFNVGFDGSLFGNHFTGTIWNAAQYAGVLTAAMVLESYSAGIFTDITSDNLGDLHLEYGIQGNGPLDLVASSGTCQFGQRNDERSTGYAAAILKDHPVGWYRLSDSEGYAQAVLSDIPTSGFWRLNGDVTDSGPSLHNGASNPTITFGIAGPLSDGSTAAHFDGTAYVDATTTAPGTNWTIEAWVRRTAAPGAAIEVVSITGVLELYGSADTVLRLYAGSVLITGNRNVMDSAWHHVMVICNGTNTKMFVDGAQDGATYAGTINIGVGSIRIGAYYGGGFNWNGDLSNVAMYNYGLSAQQLANHYALRTSTLASVIKATVADSSGGSNMGIVNGGVTFQQTSPLADGNKAALFDGATSYVTMGDVRAFAFASAFSVECWFKTSVSGIAALVSKTNGGGRGWNLTTNSSNKVRFWAYTIADVKVWDTTTPLTYNDGQWHHAVATWDGTTSAGGVVIYVDGLSVVTDTAAAGTPGQPALDFVLGSRSDVVGSPTGALSGSLDEVAVYNYKLSATRVAVHYAQRLIADDVRSVLGYYSPGNSAVRTGWKFGNHLRVRFLYSGLYYTRHRGRVQSILPDTGDKGRRQVSCTSYDVMRDLAEADIQAIPLQISKSETDIANAVFTALDNASRPVAFSLDIGVDTYPFALDNLGLSQKALSILADAAYSSQCMMACKGDGTFLLRNRHSRADIASSFTFDRDFIDFVVPSDLGGVYNFVRVTDHPKTVDAAATTVLWQATGTVISVPPNGASITLTVAFNDPTNAQKLIGGTSLVTPPVAYPTANYDYAGNTAIDGTGTDITSSLAVNVTPHASTADIQIINSNVQTAYLVIPSGTTVMLRLRGKGVYDRGPQTFKATSAQAYGKRPPLDIDMPWQSDDNVAQSTADYLQLIYNNLTRQAASVTFIANESNAKMLLALTVEPGDVITATENVSGVSATNFTVQSVKLDWVERVLTCTLTLAPANIFKFWQWGIAGRSEWDQTTIYGY